MLFLFTRGLINNKKNLPPIDETGNLQQFSGRYLPYAKIK